MSTAMECWYERHYDQLKTENAKLRKWCDFYKTQANEIEGDKNRFRDMWMKSNAENAKLLELVTQMHTCLTRPKVYAGTSQPYLIATECPYFTKGKCDYDSCGFEQRMRELGVKV